MFPLDYYFNNVALNKDTFSKSKKPKWQNYLFAEIVAVWQDRRKRSKYLDILGREKDFV